jgi:hypothetical protein
LESGIANNWQIRTKGWGNAADMSNPQYKEYHDEIMNQLTKNGTQPIDQRLAAGALYNDPDLKKQYLDGHDAHTAVMENMPKAAAVLGPINNWNPTAGPSNPEANGAKAAVIQALEKIVTDPKGRQEIEKIMNSGASDMKGKQRLLISLIRDNNKPAYDRLKETGHALT